MVKGKIRKIFIDHWNSFVKLYGNRVRPHIFKEVEKMIECGSLEKGYLVFKCEACGEEHKVGFSCKSRLCTSCGKKRTEDWVLKFSNKISTVNHRHMVFTIPEELRVYFAKNRKLLSLLPKCAAETIQSWLRDRYKKVEYIPGIVGVIHTFGRDLKWNPHVHVLVTEGAIFGENMWKRFNFFPYEMLRKRWQKILLDEIGKNLGRNQSKKEYIKLKDMIYKNLKNGFYVYGKGQVRNSKEAAKYIGRYAARPAIAESRIIGYDGKIVTFQYTDHKTNKKVIENMDALEFIGKLISHVPDKNFKMIRYYGFYSQNNKYRGKVPKLLEDKIYEQLQKLNKWEYRILKEFGVDPLECPRCKKVMKLKGIVIGKKEDCLEIIEIEIKRRYRKKIEEYKEMDKAIRHKYNGETVAIFN